MKIALLVFLFIHPFIGYTQNVGVGTATPAEKLDVNGNINLTGTIKVNGIDGSANQVLMKNSLGELAWSDMCDYKNVVSFLSGAGNWTVPAGVTKIMVECWGGGGGGNIYSGGGGGGYTRSFFDVSPGNLIGYSVGAGGTGGAGSSGNTGGTTQVVVAGTLVNTLGGAGSASSSGTAMSYYAGGLYNATAGFNNYYGIMGAPGNPSNTTYIQSGSTTFLESLSGGDGGNAANSENTGGRGSYRVVDAAGGTTIRYANASLGRRPGGGGGAGYSMLSIGGFGGGTNGGEGLVLIRY